MTSIKKVVAIVLAFLMIFSSASVLASAKVVTSFDSDKTALSIETKFFKDGEPVERVKPGDEVKARVYVGTDYYSNDSTLLFFYDKDFFDHNYTTGAAVVSNNSGVKGYINPTPDLSSQAYLTEDYLNQYGAMVVNLEVDSVNNVMFDASDWLVEITFTVKDDAGTTTENIVGDLFVNPATIQNTEEGIDAVISVPKGPEAGTDADLWPMWLWDADVTLNSTPVTSESTVTFNANGGAFETGDADSQSYTGTIETDAVPVQAEPVRAGYTFLGWDDASDDTETAGEQPEKFQYDDLVLNAVWVKNVNITFETGEGGTEIPALLDKTPGTEFPAITDPTRDGYTFRGWDPALPDVYPEEDTTYTAIWKLNVTMSFDTLGGTAIEDKHGFDGQEFDPNTVPKPEKEGYIFRNWSPALPTAYPEQDTTYTAVYEAKLYTVKFYIVENGVATLKRAARVEFDGKIPTDIVDDLIPEGYVLNGWYTDESLQTPLADDAVMGTELISLYASFEVEAYDATFDAAGGYFDGDETKTEVKVNTVFEEDIKAPADPTREGYVFKGWTPSVGVMDTVGGKRFYATWDLEENKVAYLWNNTDAPKADYEIFDIAYGDSVDMPADPDLEGYTFIGWGATADATEEAEIPATMPAGNLTYYAIWEVNKYDVTFNANEGYLDGDEAKLTKTENLAYKAAITAPKAERKGYDFVGWATTANATAADVVTVATNVPANDLTYYAVWEARTDTTYKVEYYTQGIDGEYVLEKTDDNLKGETATTATAPALEGIEGKFYLTEHKDQLLEAEIAGDGSTVLKAYYARYKYTYTFTNTGDSTVADINAFYDAPIEAPENPSWVGHTWVDWNPVLPEKMGTADATFEGKWLVNNYTVTFYANDGYLNGDKALTEKPETVPFEGKIPVPEAKRDGYTFAGWAASADSDVKVDVPETMGDEPNGLKFYAIWTANTDTTYKVEYYMQGIDGVYVLDTEKSFETAGETDTDATAPELEGLENMFTLNTAHADSNITDNINGDGSTVLKVYYSRDKHTYTFTNTGDTTIAPMELYYGAPVTEPVPTMEGHDWDGWTPDVPETMGTTNMTFTGNWTTLKYTATFHANSKGSTDAYFGTADVVTKPVETYYGNPINAPKATRPGYNFKGWSTTDGGAVVTLPSTMPAETLEYYAVWEASEGTGYTVEYYIQNTQGEYVIDNSKTLYPTGVTGDTVTAPALENIDGKFYLTTHEGQLLESTIAGDGSTVLKAYYARNQYTFKAYIDGAEVVSETYYYDAIVATPDDPAKVGYAWDNTWYSDAGCTAATTVPSNMPATDVTVYAKLVAQDVTVTIVVNYEDQINGGSQTVSVNTYKGKADSTIQIVDEIPATPAENTTYILVADLPSAESTAVSELSHYQYDAANAENAGFNATNTKVNADGSTVINVYYAPVSYTIIYMNEGSEWDSKTITYGAALELPATEPKKDGYDFLGWYLGEDKAETTDIVTGNKTYTAKYENIDYTIDYEVTGDIPESFTAPTDITNAHIGDPVVATEPDEVPGYTFSGWTVEGAVDGKVGTSNVTVTGSWAYIPYTVTYVYAGDVPAGQTAPAVVNTHIGVTVDKPAITEVPGYTVTEWVLEGDVDGKVGAGNVTATATWAYIPYTITYVYAGDIPAGQTAPDAVNTHIGETVGKPAITEVPGYTVTEWVLEGDVDGKVGAGNVTATATWAYINYTIDYEVTGDAPASFTAPTDITNAHIGDPVVATEPEKVPGYTFSGWTVEGAVDGKVGTSNVTVTGSWTHDEYSVTYTFTGDVPAGANKPADRTDAHYGDAIDLTVPNTIEGFTFGGWVVSGAAADNTVAEADVTVTGNWTRNSHKVIFNAMGGSSVEEATYSYGATIAAPEATTRPGFGFLYWYETDENTKFDFANSSMPDHDVTLYAKWQANGHTITFDSNGGTAVDQISSTFGTKVEAPTAPTRDGYTFAYWYETDEKTEFGFPYIMEDRDVELTAKWNVVPVTINYVFTGTVPPSVTEPADVTAKIGDNVDLTDNYDVYGYIFEGWNSVEGAVDNGDGTYTVGTETEITVTGNWKLQQFTVTFDSKGGSAVESVTQNYNTVVSEPFPAPTKTGHDFGKWVIAGTTDAYDFSAPLVKDVALEATWTPILYTITFNSNGGTAVDKIEAYYGDDISAKLPLDENMKKEGYTFAGWLKGNADYELPATMPAESFRLDANWVAAGDTKYTMKVFLMDTTGVYVEATEEQSTGSGTTLGNATFDAPATREGFTLNAGKSTLTGTIVADGSLVLSAYYDRNQHSVTFSNTYDTAYVGDTAGTYYYDSLITAPSNEPVREGYTFEGWYTDINDASTKLVAGTTVVPDGAVTYVANWTVNPYTITYVSDGDAATVPGVATFNYGVDTEEPATKPTKTGYTFSHWYETDETVKFVFGEAMPARNITLNAAWTANDVTVKYVFDGRVPTEAVLPETITDAHIGDVIDLTAPAGVYGYEFKGWTVEGAVDGKVYTEDVTVTGTWAINSYTITFDSKGGTAVDPITQEYKTVVAEPTDPTKTGHTFNKWVIAGTTTEYDFTAPLTADVTLEAAWDTNTYTITYVTGEGATQIPAKDYLYGATTAAPSEPQKTGYTFSHWYEGEDATAKFVFGESMPARNITLNAAFTANNVSITYTFTGNVPASAVKPADKADAHIGDVIDVTEPAAVAGYEFKGWTVEGADKNDKGEYVVDTRAVTVTGNWVINSYTIKFTDYNDAVLAEGTFVYNSAITIKPATDPSREGYTFLGYYATIDGEEVKFVDGATVPAANTTYVAKYDINSYNLTFTANGTELYSGKVEYGKELASYIPDSATVPSKDGHRFAGWALAADADTAVAVASKMPANDLSYVAVYESSIYNVYYYVKVVDGNDSTADAYKLVSTSRVEYGAVISENSNYTPAEGYEFSGWYKDEGLNTALAAGETMGNGKLSLYATETAIICDAIFEANGGKFADDATSITVPTFFEQDIIAPAAPTRAGYNFVGWTPAVGVMDNVDGKTFKAQWAAIDGAFTATYYVDGEEYEVYALAAGDSLDVPADPDKTGYEFLGWAPASVADPTEADIVSLEGMVMPAENVAYNAVFKAVSANATFYEYKDSDLGPAKNPDIGYDVYEQTAYIFGETIEMPAVPVLYNTAGESIDAYYTFQHWVDDEGNTYAADAVIEMTGAINFYPVYERVTVKLIAADGASTVIERGTASSFEEWYVYGLAESLNNSDNILDFYVDVQGDGYYTVEYVSGTAVGTGAKIKVYDNFDTSATVEEFYIIIFGDLNGDGRVRSADTGLLRNEVAMGGWEHAYLTKAADLNGDGNLRSADTGLLQRAVAGAIVINQNTGLTE